MTISDCQRQPGLGLPSATQGASDLVNTLIDFDDYWASYLDEPQSPFASLGMIVKISPALASTQPNPWPLGAESLRYAKRWPTDPSSECVALEGGDFFGVWLTAPVSDPASAFRMPDGSLASLEFRPQLPDENANVVQYQGKVTHRNTRCDAIVAAPNLAPPGACDINYPSICIPPLQENKLNCPDVPYGQFFSPPNDLHNFDNDSGANGSPDDRIGCESWPRNP